MKAKVISSEKGFTLVEVIFVIFITAILASIAVPNFLAAKDKARIAASKDNLNTILKGINMYYIDYGVYPSQASLDSSATLSILNEELSNPDNYLQQFYDNKIQEYKTPPVTAGDDSPFEILVRTKTGVNKQGKVCWLYYSEAKEMIEVWVAP